MVLVPFTLIRPPAKRPTTHFEGNPLRFEYLAEFVTQMPYNLTISYEDRGVCQPSIRQGRAPPGNYSDLWDLALVAEGFDEIQPQYNSRLWTKDNGGISQFAVSRVSWVHPHPNKDFVRNGEQSLEGPANIPMQPPR